MSLQIIGTIHYDSYILIWVLEYFVTFRSLYNKLWNDFKLPNLRTFAALTSNV